MSYTSFISKKYVSDTEDDDDLDDLDIIINKADPKLAVPKEQIENAARLNAELQKEVKEYQASKPAPVSADPKKDIKDKLKEKINLKKKMRSGKMDPTNFSQGDISSLLNESSFDSKLKSMKSKDIEKAIDRLGLGDKISGTKKKTKGSDSKESTPAMDPNELMRTIERLQGNIKIL